MAKVRVVVNINVEVVYEAGFDDKCTIEQIRTSAHRYAQGKVREIATNIPNVTVLTGTQIKEMNFKD